MKAASHPPLFIGSEIYRGLSYGAGHPLRVPRVSTTIDLCRAMGWLPPDVYITSPRAKPDTLKGWHTPEYIDALARAERDQRVTEDIRQRHQLGTPSNPIFAEMYRRPATAAGGSLLAGELLAQGGVLYHPGGGTHHGMPDHASGFCYLNDPVLAIRSLRRNGVGRIAYVDIDAHHGDGVQHAFEKDPDTLVMSIHEAGLWPRTGPFNDQGVGNVFNLPVARGLNDDEMTLILEHLILPAVEVFAPEAIVLQCGADAVLDDPLSHLALSNNAHWAVVRALKPFAPRYLVLGGGGYNPWTVGRLWAGVWATLNGHHIPERLPAEAEKVLRALHFDGNRRGRNPPDHWFEALQDARRFGPIRDPLRADVQYLVRRARSGFKP